MQRKPNFSVAVCKLGYWIAFSGAREENTALTVTNSTDSLEENKTTV